MNDELLPCPFCGGSVSVIPCCYLDEYTDESSYSWKIAHNDLHSGCHCSLNVYGEYRTLECKEADAQKQRLIEAWNTRA